MAVDILLVDDDAIQAATRKAILERSGHVVQIAANGRDASAILAEATFSPRMVISDHLMPGMNGPEFVKWLRKAGFVFPVLVLSGYPDAEEQYESLDVVFRVKPFPPEQLVALTQYLLNNSERRTA